MPHEMTLHLDGDHSPRWVFRRLMVQIGKYVRYLKALSRGEFSGPEIYRTKIKELIGCKATEKLDAV